MVTLFPACLPPQWSLHLRHLYRYPPTSACFHWSSLHIAETTPLPWQFSSPWTGNQGVTIRKSRSDHYLPLLGVIVRNLLISCDYSVGYMDIQGVTIHHIKEWPLLFSRSDHSCISECPFACLGVPFSIQGVTKPHFRCAHSKSRSDHSISTGLVSVS